MQNALEYLFYVYALTIHWHVVPSTTEDLLVYQVIECLASEAYCFGQQIEEHERWLLDRQLAMKDFVQEEKWAMDKTLQNVQVAL